MTAFKVFVFIVIVALALGSGIFMNGSLDKRVTERAAQKALITEQTKQNIMEQFKKEDVVVGQGQEAKSGDTLAVHYAGTLADGTKFDSSYDHGEPIEFKLGAGDVIPGWDLGLLGVRVGGKRNLVIPPELAYGDRSAGPIPPNSTLYFTVELVDVK
ncbi:MAG: Peptidyl-prolyl cis-trans isomerase [Parcubacteria group bacterium GW2011_GWB1_56_8]|nr:MAG: Peptidyl-prolyl cis-trans isomerase [Parcubacteria group bacterium GW2011_GWB1_56_8]